MKRAPLALPLLTLCACGDYPRDTEGTLERVRGGAVRVGRIDGAGVPALDRLAARVAERAGARAEVTPGAAEPLLRDLERGRLDLVVGPFDAKSPWEARVTFSKPVAVDPPLIDPELKARAAVRNGEHRWAMEVDRAVADIGEDER